MNEVNRFRFCETSPIWDHVIIPLSPQRICITASPFFIPTIFINTFTRGDENPRVRAVA